MATTSLAIGNDVLSTTLYVLNKDWRDALHTTVAFLDAHTKVHGEGQPTQDGGSRIIQPIGFGNHSRTTKMSTGYERIDLSVGDVTVPAVYDFAHIIRPIAISGEEERTNSGASAILSMLDIRSKQVAAAARRDFVRQIVAGNVSQWDGFNTLNGVDAQVGNAGFLEHEAVGSQTNTVGGISKSTYSTVLGWQNQSYDGSNSFNANGLDGMYSLGVDSRAVSPSGMINIWLVSGSAFKNLKRALSASERYVDQAKIDGGRIVEFWDGVQIAHEYYMPNAGASTATTPISAYALCLDDIHMMWDPAGYFEVDEFKTVSGEYDVRAANLHVRGQLIAKHLGSSGLAHSLDTF